MDKWTNRQLDAQTVGCKGRQKRRKIRGQRNGLLSSRRRLRTRYKLRTP